MIKLLVPFLLLLFICSCNSPKEQSKVNNSNDYFNLKDYFEKEANRLNGINPPINKTVMIDGQIEQKKIKISDYTKELNNFISSDINKASWKGAYKITKKDNSLSYTTESDKIPVKKVDIHYQNNQIKSIQILLKTTNILYQSSDTLTYFVDSLYEIKKTQKIKLLNQRNYAVIGRFK